jgi:hypothetical protein
MCLEAVKYLFEETLKIVPKELREEVRALLASWIADREPGDG